MDLALLWKMRKLGIPTVVDRVVQQAISQVLGSIFENNLANLVTALDKGSFMFVFRNFIIFL